MRLGRTLTPDQVADSFVRFQHYEEYLEGVLNRIQMGEYASPIIAVKRAWEAFVSWGRHIAEALLVLKEIPNGKAKPFEQMFKTFQAQRVPKDPVGWYMKNQASFVLLKQAVKWPDKGAGAESLQQFTLGPFIVHNTLMLMNEELEGIKDTLQLAAAKIKALKVPGIEKVLYGEVFVVGDLRGKNTLAWYNITDDHVYVRPINRASHDTLSSTVHELGHRYWRKFMDRDRKIQWMLHYRNLRSSNASVKMPEPGDIFPIPISGKKRLGPLTVEKVENGKFYLSHGVMVDVFGTRQILRNQANFPTLYAAESDEEFFCECLGLYAAGRLSAEHVQAFQAIVERGQTADQVKGMLSVEKVARRAVRGQHQFLAILDVAAWGVDG